MPTGLHQTLSVNRDAKSFRQKIKSSLINKLGEIDIARMCMLTVLKGFISMRSKPSFKREENNLKQISFLIDIFQMFRTQKQQADKWLRLGVGNPQPAGHVCTAHFCTAHICGNQPGRCYLLRLLSPFQWAAVELSNSKRGSMSRDPIISTRYLRKLAKSSHNKRTSDAEFCFMETMALGTAFGLRIWLFPDHLPMVGLELHPSILSATVLYQNVMPTRGKHFTRLASSLELL